MTNSERPSIIETQAYVRWLLQRNGASTHQWGKNGFKSIEDLAQEVHNGESELLYDYGTLVRRVGIVSIDVRHIDADGKEWQLIEEMQRLPDGSERRRGLTGVSEKIKRNEDPQVTALRGLAEELGLTEYENDIILSDRTNDLGTSYSYPGLITASTRYTMSTYLSTKQFDPDGYREEQNGQLTFFSWQEVPSQER